MAIAAQSDAAGGAGLARVQLPEATMPPDFDRDIFLSRSQIFPSGEIKKEIKRIYFLSLLRNVTISCELNG